LVRGEETTAICTVKSSLSPTGKFVTSPSYFEKGGTEASVGSLMSVRKSEAQESFNEIKFSIDR
jgi:hypothetical protein